MTAKHLGAKRKGVKERGRKRACIQSLLTTAGLPPLGVFASLGLCVEFCFWPLSGHLRNFASAASGQALICGWEPMIVEQLYQQRLNRYVTAMRNESADRVPIRPFVAEFTAKYAGYTCQEVAHDYSKAFDAAIKTAKDFDWDAVVPNMVYVWTGLAQAVGLRYYGIPGLGIPHNSGFNYIEPPEDQPFMRKDEYDALIDDPTAFLSNV